MKLNRTDRLKATLKLSTTIALLAVITAPAYAQISSTATGEATIITPDGTPLVNPGTSDNGVTIEVFAGDSHTIANGTAGRPRGSNISLDDGQDDTILEIAGTLISNDQNDENTVIFIDNSENDVIINVANTGILRGVDGVIYAEGDGLRLTNAGLIEGTGNADEGVVYFDREVDGNAINFITNTGTITGVGGPTIGVDASRSITSLVITNAAGAFITNNDAADDSDSDAINFNGDPGNESNIERGCLSNPGGNLAIPAGGDSGDFDTSTFDIAGANVRCRHNLTVDNSGTISTERNADTNAGIVIESDAIARGTITNNADGIISGANTGIIVNGAHSEHDLTIENAGTILGTSNTGVLITGAGVTVDNQSGGIIEGGLTGILVSDSITDIRIGPISDDEVADGNADPLDILDVPVTAENLTFNNAGTIKGSVASLDASNAGAAITFNQFGGGALDGDFIGTQAHIDTFNLSAGRFTLTHDILESVNVNIAADGILDVDGVRTIDGDLRLAGGILEIDFASTTEFDILNIIGDIDATQAFTLSLNFSDDFNFDQSAELNFLSVGGSNDLDLNLANIVINTALGNVSVGINSLTGNLFASIIGVTVSEVPLPAAAPLFLSALLGGGYMNRRRKKAKAS